MDSAREEVESEEAKKHEVKNRDCRRITCRALSQALPLVLCRQKLLILWTCCLWSCGALVMQVVVRRMMMIAVIKRTLDDCVAAVAVAVLLLERLWEPNFILSFSCFLTFILFIATFIHIEEEHFMVRG